METKEKETFITEDGQEDGFSILCDADDVMGVDMISQSTLLQRKLDEMKSVDEELLSTKRETDAIIARVEIGENEFRTKQEMFRKQIANFQKFIIDSDRKKARKLKQIEEERKQISAKKEVISKLEEELQSLNRLCGSLNRELLSLIKYQNYLNLVVNSSSNSYSMIDELLQRYTILIDTHNALKAQNLELNANIERTISDKNRYIKKQQNVILVKNSTIAQCIKLIEKKRGETVHLEHTLFSQYQKNQELHKIHNTVKLSIINIYNRIYQSYTFKKPKYLHIQKEHEQEEEGNAHFNLLLNEIKQRLCDLIDIKNHHFSSPSS